MGDLKVFGLSRNRTTEEVTSVHPGSIETRWSGGVQTQTCCNDQKQVNVIRDHHADLVCVCLFAVYEKLQ